VLAAEHDEQMLIELQEVSITSKSLSLLIQLSPAFIT